MKCKYCGAEMRLDDCDRDGFPKGSMDKYWIRDECGAAAIEQIRNGVSAYTSWDKEE